MSKLDLMDRFSLFVNDDFDLIDRRFFRKFAKIPRLNKKKPGRELIVHHDQRFPLINGFRPDYIYTVDFQSKGVWAGNHYHKLKHEIFIPLAGEFLVMTQDVQSNEYRGCKISAHADRKTSEKFADFPSDSERVVHNLYIRTMLAHKVICESDQGILLVLATSPNNDGDEFPYEVLGGFIKVTDRAKEIFGLSDEEVLKAEIAIGKLFAAKNKKSILPQSDKFDILEMFPGRKMSGMSPHGMIEALFDIEPYKLGCICCWGEGLPGGCGGCGKKSG